MKRVESGRRVKYTRDATHTAPRRNEKAARPFGHAATRGRRRYYGFLEPDDEDDDAGGAERAAGSLRAGAGADDRGDSPRGSLCGGDMRVDSPRLSPRGVARAASPPYECPLSRALPPR